MKRLIVSVTRGVSIAAVLVTLSGPAIYGAVRDKENPSIGDRIVRVIRRVMGVVMGDGLVEPKPTNPPTP